MEKELKISVIIPIYNTERYIEQCITSVINQSYQNLDIIYVNDGSKDNSVKIIEQYQQFDSRIRIINKTNGGISSARNLGLQYAQGSYITFLDSDDYLAPDIYSYCIKQIQGKERLPIIFQFQTFGAEQSKALPNKIEEGFNDYQSLMTHLAYKQRINNAVWNKLYPKELVQGLTFIEGRLGEDASYNYLALERAKGFIFVKKLGYHYRKEQSTNSLSNNIRRLHIDTFNNFKENIKNNLILNTDTLSVFLIRYLNYIFRSKEVNSLSLTETKALLTYVSSLSNNISIKLELDRAFNK